MGNSELLQQLREGNFDRLLRPKSVAIIGASKDPLKAGYQAVRALAGFAGAVYAVNPRETEILGRPCFKDLAALPVAVDLAILAMPAAHCVEVAQQAAARGVGGIWILSGGFGESGEEGARLQSRLREICHESGMRLLGPNTSGFIHPHAGCVASFVPGTERLQDGHVGVVAQSGGMNLSIAFMLDRLGYGVSLAVGLGNAVDVDSADVVQWLADDGNTHSIALHLEGVPDGRRLFDALRCVTRRKPVVALVAGKADIGEFAQSHTGNLMGSRERTVAALTQAGVVVVDSTEELAQAAAVLSLCRLPPRSKPGFALVTGQAGPGLLIADGLRSLELELPELGAETYAKVQKLLPPLTFVKNPVDTGRPGPTFQEVVQRVGEDAQIDAVLVFGLHEPAVLDPVQVLAPVAWSLGKPVLFGSVGLEDDIAPTRKGMAAHSLPLLESPERLVLAARALALDAQAQARMRCEDSRDAASPVISTDGRCRRLADGTLAEDDAKALLAQYGIAIPRRHHCSSRDEAVRAFGQLKAPIVAKISSPEILHKTEAGGVHLNLRTEADLGKALDALDAIPLKGARGYLLEEMAASGVELIIGGVRDASWGPCVMLGIGGVFAEALGDTVIRLAPLSLDDVDDMLGGLRGKALLDGFRHLPPSDRLAIGDALRAISTLMDEHPEIREVEINPLRVYRNGALALDALVVVDAADPGA